jgi:hypothetical protein
MMHFLAAATSCLNSCPFEPKILPQKVACLRVITRVPQWQSVANVGLLPKTTKPPPHRPPGVLQSLTGTSMPRPRLHLYFWSSLFLFNKHLYRCENDQYICITSSTPYHGNFLCCPFPTFDPAIYFLQASGIARKSELIISAE